MRDAFDLMKSIEDNPYADITLPYYASSAEYYKAKYLRDKRCLLTYLLWRQRQIADSWWTAHDNQIRPSLSSDESEYLLEYNNLMVEYMTHFAVPVDLRAFLWRPPASTQLEVRGLMDHVFVSTITGNTISIYSGKQILLNFEDAESLIQQRVVELV
ncbi:GINS complex subunit 1 [Strigomonas culicis]|nr:GINS complex subunit 1 [Strigomonas culicis]|eukprot:EPY19176.1 GINS complex subunit 1 [Strigomonas culicis]